MGVAEQAVIAVCVGTLAFDGRESATGFSFSGQGTMGQAFSQLGKLLRSLYAYLCFELYSACKGAGSIYICCCCWQDTANARSLYRRCPIKLVVFNGDEIITIPPTWDVSHLGNFIRNGSVNGQSAQH